MRIREIAPGEVEPLVQVGLRSVIVGRSPTVTAGRPFPLLHLKEIAGGR